MEMTNSYDRKYAGKDFYWGKRPSGLCAKVLEFIKPKANFRPKLLDLGCGEGRNAVYFAQQGFEVTGVDLSSPGLEKTQRYAKEVGVSLTIVQADLKDYRPEAGYDVIFSTGVLHYLPLDLRADKFAQYQTATAPQGINAFAALVKKPFIARAPDAAEGVVAFKSGELLGYYWDWEIVFCAEEIFDCNSSGVPHRHAISRVIARRCQGEG
jgi:tellurite methyltransferase